MGLQEIFVRVECKEFDDLVKALTKKGFDVRLNKRKV
jgi:acetoin utilization protein AcuB